MRTAVAVLSFFLPLLIIHTRPPCIPNDCFDEAAEERMAVFPSVRLLKTGRAFQMDTVPDTYGKKDFITACHDGRIMNEYERDFSKYGIVSIRTESL